MVIFTVTGSDSAGEVHQWESPDGRAVVTISAATAKNVTREILDGFRALPKGGIEVGGLLIGSIDGDSTASIRIDSFEPVPCEHKHGPSYALSDVDHAKFQDIFAKTNESGARVIGLYRSCRLGRDLTPDSVDDSLIEQYFRSAPCVFLALKPVSMTHCVAEFTFKGHGSADYAMTAAGQAAVEPPAILTLPHPVVEPSAAAAVLAEAPEPSSPPESPLEKRLHRIPDVLPRRVLYRDEEEGPPPNGSRSTMWLSVALCFAIGWGGAATYQWMRLSQEPRPASLGLQVQPAEGILEVKWNGSLPPVRNASGGELSISDGGNEKKVALTREAVARGAYSYSPSTSNIAFRLTVHTRGTASTESMKVLTDVRPLLTASVKPAATPAPAVAQPPPAAPAPPVTTEAFRQPAVEPPAQEKPASPPRITSSPKVVSEVQPTIPDGIRSRIRSAIVVPVMVEISASGRVVTATPQPGGDGLYRYLAGRAATAARSWRFLPARASNGAAVPARHTVYFTFRG